MIGIGNYIGKSSVAPASYDSDAQTFFTAASITDTTQKNAVNTLVLGLKSYSLWDSFTYIYPFVGGSATSHRYNLKNPATFLITYYGGWTHSSTGALSNGTTGYADTGMKPSVNMSRNDTHVSVYIRNNPANVNTYAFGATGSGNSLHLKDTGAYAVNANTGSSSSGASLNDNFGIINRELSTHQDLYFNGALDISNAVSSSGLNINFMYFGARNLSGAAADYCDAEFTFKSAGLSFTATEIGYLNTLVQAFQTSLSR